MPNTQSRRPAGTTPRSAKSERIEMRVTPEEDQLLSLAADLSHLSKTAFILTAAAERAKNVVRAAHSYPLSPEAFDSFLAELDRPAEVVPGLADLFARTRQTK